MTGDAPGADASGPDALGSDWPGRDGPGTDATTGDGREAPGDPALAPDDGKGVRPPERGTWSVLSTITAKTEIEPVDPLDALAAVESLAVATWRYEAEDEGVRHMGPMAEDFHDAFGLGHDERHIATVDADGVALAAIQGLVAELAARDERIDALEAENERTRERLWRLESALEPGEPLGQPGGRDD